MTPHQRLGFLASRLRQPLPPDVTFNMDIWQQKQGCGTAACAAGLGAMLPELQADGLGCLVGDIGAGLIQACGETGFRALEKFFDLSPDRTRHVFDANRYGVPYTAIAPAMVADRIDQVVAELGDGETAPPS